MEAALSSKVAEFMTALDQVKKYKTLAASMTDFVLIILGTVVTALSVNISICLSSLFIGKYVGFSIVSSSLIIVLFPAGIIVAVFWVRHRIKSITIGQWKNKLNEGAPGALELLQNIQWDSIFSDIRYAKLGFFLYEIAKTLVYWVFAAALLFVFNGLVESVLHMTINYVVVMLVSLVVVLVLSKNDLHKRYDQMGRLDWLLWELRWFESEFRGANFEA
ncbi:MAG: hypothetical protein NWF06_06980 [Candidatus Bathyarchaeota archaeon]|nr:hypothetical protein [Candidatus Bathyarchaeum sp.]